MPLLLTNEDIRKVFTMKDCVDAVEATYREQGFGRIVNREPPRSHTYLPTRDPNVLHLFKCTDGGVPALGTHVIRMTSDSVAFKTEGGKKRRVKFPAIKGKYYLGLYLLFHNDDGNLAAICHDAYINQLGVGARVGVGVKTLANPDAEVAAIIGSGWFARGIAEALSVVRKLKEIRVFSPTAANRKTFAEEMGPRLNLKVLPMESSDAAVSDADIVVTITNAAQPVLDGRHLKAGCCVVSSAGPVDRLDQREEIDEETFRRADLIAVGQRAHAFHIGEYERLVEKGLLDWNRVPELGDILAGKAAGRTDKKQVTLFFQNLPGGAQHCAMTTRAYEKAKASGLGKELPDELFLQDMRP